MLQDARLPRRLRPAARPARLVQQVEVRNHFGGRKPQADESRTENGSRSPATSGAVDHHALPMRKRLADHGHGFAYEMQLLTGAAW